MNLNEEKYSKFALIREMLETPGNIQSFDPRSFRTVCKEDQIKKGIIPDRRGKQQAISGQKSHFFIT